MPGKQPTDVNLPASFLEAMAEYQRNPLSVLRRNFPPYLPFIAGGAPEDGDGAGSGDGSGNDGNSGGSGGADGDGNSGTGDGAGTGNDADDDDDDDADEGLPDNIKSILRKNRKATREAERRAERAEREAKAAADKAKEYDDRDKSELQKAQDRTKELETENAKLRDDNKAVSLRSAFLAHTGVTWVDPEDALELAMRKYGLSELEVSDAGTVDAKKLGKIVKDMAAEKGYLVKTGDGAGGGKGGDAGKGQASGGAFNGGSGKGDGKSVDKLANKYPAMRGRRRVP